MNDTESLTIEFILSPSSASDVNAGRPPSSGHVRITTANGTEQYELEQFMYSVNQFIDAVPNVLEGDRGSVSSVDTLYIVLERKDETRGYITTCIGRKAVLNPEHRLPREKRSLDTVVALSTLVDSVLTAFTGLLERIKEINEDIDDYEWYQELHADCEEIRKFAADHLP